MEIGLMAVALAAIAFSAWRMREQDKTISDLHDRLMARNYVEYVAHQPRSDRPPEAPERKPLSWYDDGGGDA